MAIVSITTNNDCDFNRTFVWQTVGGAAIDLTSMTLFMLLRLNASDPTAVARFATDTHEITILAPPTAGKFQLFIPQATLAKIGAGNYDHSLIRQDGSGNKISIWTGTFIINPGPSR